MIRNRSARARLYPIGSPTACGLLVLCALSGSTVLADGIEPGLWQVVSRTQTGGVIGPPHESSKCLPIERSLSGSNLTWRLTCKGQLDMELTGEFNFDSPRHYTATVQSKAAMAGMPMVDSQENIEARWLSACPQ
jgi:hypothetical protein